ncbi:MAG: DUF6785 family protein [Planctomycetota bacterium]
MTARAIILGLIAALLIPVAGYFSDQVVRLTVFVGCQFPIVVFAPLVLVLIVSNYVGGRRRLRSAELAVIVTMALVACNIPGGGLLRMLSRSVGMPIYFNDGNTAWEKARALGRVPAVMLPGGGKYDEEFMEGFLSGRGEAEGFIRPERVPWDKWARPLAFWMPLALLLGFASICLGLIVHKQWAERERLKYPIAEFTNSLLASEGPEGKRGIFRDRLFWLGLILLLAFHVVNGLAAWWPQRMIRIPSAFSFAPFLQKYQKLSTHWVAACLFSLQIWPMVIAFGFLIPSDVSLSLGLSQFLWVPITAWLVHVLGVQVHGKDDLGAPANWQRAGSCLAIAVMILYTGRAYYWNVLKSAVSFRRHREVESYAAWACRFFVLAMISMVALLHWAGLAWPLAVLLVCLVMLTYLIQARINTESGLILSLLTWMPSCVLLGLFGGKALGPGALAICGLVCTVFARDTHECLMPFFLNSMKISEVQRVPPRRAGRVAAVAFAVALLVGVPYALWVDHSYGVMRGEPFATRGAPYWTIDAVRATVTELKGANDLRQAEQMSVWQRFASMDPKPSFVWAAGLGFAVVLLIAALRLRYSWWPIHPMMFLVWGTWAMAMLNHSLLIGWAVKKMVTKFGGSRSYNRVRLLMFGVIAGELLGGVLWMIVGAIYHAVTGHSPPRYKIFPGG